MRHTLQNDAPADGFADCYLLGNGALGAAVHGHPGTERLDLNLDTLWSGGPAGPAVTPSISSGGMGCCRVWCSTPWRRVR
jgi:alpha-L-fucosidase 2